MSGALTIARFRADCEVAADAAAAASFRDSAGKALRDHTAAGLRTSLAAWVDGPDDSVWIVRRLEIGVVVDVATPADALGSEIARGLKAALTRALAGDGDGITAMRFAGRAAYLARFLTEIVAGDPWRLWYFAPLSGLKLLDRSGAIAAALTRRPELAWPALAMLDDGTLRDVARSLSAADADRVLDCLAAGANPASTPVERVVAAACDACTHAVATDRTHGAVVYATVRAGAAVNPRLLRDAVETILAATAAASGGRTEVRLRAIAAIVAAAASHGATDTAPRLADLIDRGVRAAIDAAPHRRTTDRPALPLAAAAGEEIEILSTPFGGAIFLLREADQVPWEAWTQGWPDASGTRAATLLKWGTLALAAGREQSCGFLGDPTWRRLLGVAPDLTLDGLAAWAEEIGDERRTMLAREVASACGSTALAAAERRWCAVPRRCTIHRHWCAALAPVARTLLRACARRLPGFAGSTPSFLWAQLLSATASMEFAADRIVVRYGRPPLHLLLTLTGMTRGLVVGADALGRPIVVFPAE